MEPHPYRQAFAARDVDALVALLADDAVFHSPVIGDPGFEGPAAIAALHEVLFDAVTDTEYTHDLGDEQAHVLVANARVLGKPVKATTLLELNATGQVREIWVMVRPLTGAAAIVEAIGSGLAARQSDRQATIVRAATKPLAGLAAATDRVGARVVAALNRSSA